MFKVFSTFALLLLLGCSSNINNEKLTTDHYLSDQSFIGVYLKYVSAESNYFRNYSNESKQKLITAIAPLKHHVDNGNPIAQLSYGTSKYIIDYKSNAKVFQDLLLKSSETGYLPATRKLAMFYQSGQHFGKNLPKALKLLEANATYGHGKDIKTLLVLYKKLPFIGEKSSKYIKLEARYKLSKDLNYQKRLAENGSLESQRIYGHLLYHQSIEGGKDNFYEAAYWLSIVSKNKLNPQAAYDSSRAIYALSKLSASENLKLIKDIAKFSELKT